MNTDRHGSDRTDRMRRLFYRFQFLSVFICVNLWLISSLSCSSKPTDLRTLAPAETLVYLETNDLGAALQPIVEEAWATVQANPNEPLSPAHKHAVEEVVGMINYLD